MEEKISVVEEKPLSYKNEYQITRKKGKRSVLNLLLLQVGICLAVSLGVFLFRAISGGVSVVPSSVGFFDFVTV